MAGDSIAQGHCGNTLNPQFTDCSSNVRSAIGFSAVANPYSNIPTPQLMHRSSNVTGVIGSSEAMRPYNSIENRHAIHHVLSRMHPQHC